MFTFERNSPISNYTKQNLAMIASVLFMFLTLLASAQTNSKNRNDDSGLLDSYIKSKGYDSTIVFSAESIKQFWTDNSVISKDGLINILLDSSFKSPRLKIQLANVNVTHKCKIDVISNTGDLKFSVLNGNSTVIAESTPEDDFIEYHITSASFNLKSSEKLVYFLQFSSNSLQELQIKKIILSFPRVNNLTDSSVTLSLKKDGFDLMNAKAEKDDNGCIQLTGKQSRIFGKRIELPSNNAPLFSYVSIKNIGKTATRIFVGYASYSKDEFPLDERNYPYKKINTVLNVISSTAGSNKVIVDKYSEWKSNCALVLNANEDLSDIPNNTIAGRIVDVKEMDNNAEITLDRPIKDEIKKGTKVRIHGVSNGAYLYPHIVELQPKEEISFYTTMKKDDDSLQLSWNCFSRGASFVIPLLLSYSVDPNEENTISITDYSISY